MFTNLSCFNLFVLVATLLVGLFGSAPDTAEGQDAMFFRRGDVDSDGEIQFSDGFAFLQSLFLENTPPPCLDAADANDDGIIDLSDVIEIFVAVIISEELPGPIGVCGADPTDDALGCSYYAPCVADLSTLIALGDSLMAGFRNGSLYAAGQSNGFAALIAAAAGVAFPLPLVPYPGVPNVLELISDGPPPVVAPVQLPAPDPPRVDPFTQSYNFAVPGQTAWDAILVRPDFPIDSLVDIVLGLPGLFDGLAYSQVEWAEVLNPTTALVWLGSNDILCVLTTGDTACLTSVDDFQAAISEVIDRVGATGARLVVGNVPDISIVPYLYTLEEIADIVGLPAAIVGGILGLEPGDSVLYPAWEDILVILGDASQGPLSESQVITSAEFAEIEARTADFNAIIADECAAHGAALVDLHALTTEIDANGLVACDLELTTDPLGGVFSLDAIHPTFAGHAAIANAFIEVLNGSFGAGIPPVDVDAAAADDPLIECYP